MFDDKEKIEFHKFINLKKKFFWLSSKTNSFVFCDAEMKKMIVAKLKLQV